MVLCFSEHHSKLFTFSNVKDNFATILGIVKNTLSNPSYPLKYHIK